MVTNVPVLSAALPCRSEHLKERTKSSPKSPKSSYKPYAPAIIVKVDESLNDNYSFDEKHMKKDRAKSGRGPL